MKPKSSGPKNPKPNDPLAGLPKSELEKRGIRIGLPITSALAGLGTVAITRKSQEARLDAKGSRQESRAGKKEVRANRIEETRPAKAAKLRERAADLNTRGAANKKAAEMIYKSKAKKK
jgi:hypothetical protein